MNAAALENGFATQLRLPAAARFAIAVVIAAVLAAAWLGVEHESHDAVLVAGTAIKNQPLHVLLPKVEVVGHRAG